MRRSTVVVYLTEQPDGTTRPDWVAFSAHDEVGDDLRRRWDDPDLTVVGAHPVVHAGIGSHSGSYLAGEYLTRFEPPAFERLLRIFRAATRAMLPWTRDSAHAGIGVPYVDYARGDGVSIGPGGDRAWTPVLVDDDTPWVFHYQGLWGNDTADPLGGERGPAGPRYERSGAVRESWGDIIGWSGLAKVAPTAQAARELIRVRLAELDDELRSATEDLDAMRTVLRADAASGVIVTRGHEQQVGEVVARRVSLADERRRLEARLAAPSARAGPHDHLRHRDLPTHAESTGRRRLLALWSALSTPVILIVIGNAFRPGATATLRGVVVVTVLALLTIEAITRRQLVRFVVTLAVLSVAGGVIVGFVSLVVIQGWHLGVSVLCGVLALVLLLNNLNELDRD